MKTVAQIKKEVLATSAQPQNFVVEVKHNYGKTYTVKFVMGLIDDYEKFCGYLKREGYKLFG
jgi:hypothetical protein